MASDIFVQAFNGGYKVVDAEDNTVINRFYGPNAEAHANELVAQLLELDESFGPYANSNWKDCPF